jgi:nitrite reductase (NADH) small subunit
MSVENRGMATAPPQTGLPADSVPPQWQAICAVAAIPRLGARRVERPGFSPVAVFRAGDDAIFALIDRCPHKGGPLSQGIVFGHSVACPLHNWTIGLADGCAAAPDNGCTPRVAVRVQDGTVQLDLGQFEPLPAALPAPADADA